MSQTQQPAPPAGIDPLYSDCVIKSKSGCKFYTFTGAMVGCSPVFRDLVKGSVGKPSAEDGDHEGLAPQSATKDMVGLMLDDTDEGITALVEYLHQPEKILGSVLPTVTKEGAVSILHLAPIAFKYDIQGNSLLSW
jgi:hypothetical protein